MNHNEICSNLNEQGKLFLEKFGQDIQLDCLVEELSELIQEICKYKRNKYSNKLADGFYFRDNIIKEFIDVNFVLNQLLMILEISIDNFYAKYENNLLNLYKNNLRLLNK